MAMMSRRQAIAAGNAALLVFATVLLFEWGVPTVTAIVSYVALIGSSAFALVCLFTAARGTHGQARVSWLCLSFGVAGWVAGELVQLHATLAGYHAPAGMMADLGYLALPVGVSLAAALTQTSQGGYFGIRLLLDGVIAGTSSFIVLWTPVLRDLFAAGTLSGISMARPVADISMVCLSVLTMAKAGKGYRRVPAYVTAGVVVIALSDGSFIYACAHGMNSSAAITVGWVIGIYLIGLGALHSDNIVSWYIEAPKRPPRRSIWLPYLPLPFAFIITTAALWDTDVSIAPVLGGVGIALVFAAFARQLLLLEENRRLLVTVANMALSDQLTGLANRALFADRMAHAIQLRERNSAPVAVLLADLDDFKLVNDSLGHPVGDEMLRSVGERIQNSVRTGDTVARIGGDEFAILVEDAPAIAEQIAERIVRSFDEPFVMDDRTVYMRLSIGLATAVGDAEVSAEELFKRADLAMYSAKRAHVGARSFTPDMRRDATELNLPSQQKKTGRRGGVARIQLLGDLRRAIDEREFDLVYQPKISLMTGKAVGVEALIRWPHPEFGLLEPADFLPLVRENGLMEAVTDLVLERAIGDAASWRESASNLAVAINLSAPSLNDEALPARILSELARHDMPPTSLTVEITEDLLLASVVRARSVLDELRASGIRVAIDDFGSGYGAMTYLHELPIDELKLDRQFVAPIEHDDRAAAIVRSVIELAHQFGLTSVAEGVEDKATAELLTSFGCGFAQGHYFSPPVPAQAIRLDLWRSAPTREAHVDPRTSPTLRQTSS
jgi:diguanylate cyclase (GGDEF)-like protein